MPAQSGPLAPVTAERLALHPLGVADVRLAGGFWGHWQQANGDVTIPHGLEWLRRDGALDNFLRLIGQSAAPARRGEVYSDSDVYKMLEAIAWQLSIAPSEQLRAAAERLIDVIELTQQDDGYLNTFVQAGLASRFGNLPGGHELYCAGHLFQAAIAYRRATGDMRLLGIARRFADLLVRAFIGGDRPDTDGHPEVEMALVELYRETGEGSYLELAQRLIDVRGHGVLGPGPFGPRQFLDELPFRDRHEIDGHAVRALYLLSGAVDVYLETGERELLDAALDQWRSMANSKSYVTGAVGARFEGEAFGDPYELPPDLAYGETCAAIASIMASWRLLLATGDGRHAELIERTLYNAFAASTALTRTGFFYVNPLQRRRPRPAAPTDGKPVNADAPGTRAAWYDSACCPPNIMRLIASLGGYLVTADEHGAQLHQYLPAHVSAGGAELRVETDYPASGDIVIRFERAPRGSWTLALRIPSWAQDPLIEIDGRARPAVPNELGYHLIERSWADGDAVVLRIPMPVRFTAAHPAVDAVRGSVAIERGPIVYCLETLATEAGPDLDAVEVDASLTATTLGVPGLPEGLPGLRVHGALRDDRSWADSAWGPVGAEHGGSGEPVELVFLPYLSWANRGPSAMRVWVPEHPAARAGD